MSHTLVSLPFSSSPNGQEVKNLQKINAYELHTPANTDLKRIRLYLRSYESLIKVLLPKLYLYPVSDLHNF